MKKYIALLMVLMVVIGIMPMQVFADRDNEGGLDLQRIFREVISKTTDYFKKVANRFSDMGNHWANVTVGKLVELGILDGYGDGTFRPNNTITRGEFSKVVRTSLKLDLVKGNSFDDTNNHWAKNEIHTLVQNGIIIKSEYGDNYEPNKNITRIEMAKMIVRAVGLDERAKELAGQKTKFNDDNTIKSEDKGYIIIASENGIINGYPDNTFKPNGEATRAEASQMIVNMFDALDRGIDTGEETVEKPTKPISIEIDERLKNPKYIQTENFRIDDTGQIYVKRGDKEYKVESEYDPLVNNKVLKLLNELVDENHYVTIGYNKSRESVLVEYKMSSIGNTTHFRINIALKPFDVSSYGEGFSKETDGYIDVSRLFGSAFEGSFVLPHYEEKLRKALIIILGETDGEKAHDYIISEFKNKVKGLPDDMSNLESYKGKTEVKKLDNSTLYMWNDDFFNKAETFFYYTND